MNSGNVQTQIEIVVIVTYARGHHLQSRHPNRCISNAAGPGVSFHPPNLGRQFFRRSTRGPAMTRTPLMGCFSLFFLLVGSNQWFALSPRMDRVRYKEIGQSGTHEVQNFNRKVCLPLASSSLQLHRARSSRHTSLCPRHSYALTPRLPLRPAFACSYLLPFMAPSTLFRSPSSLPTHRHRKRSASLLLL
jgi:hypothetical protein